ncbi:HAMP domain-containing protein [Streptomyces halobius]|uniref:HAMP domain-containing protein n=1 Tax=Streptomyces halobius TaxID=2879846 RepID=A0ABY4MLX9_9ACTN|nr:HAMP domain-containing protein [Streptomyces halobius]UQA98068.1 HAMP domain-containing protein [Streptomyces halobius]
MSLLGGIRPPIAVLSALLLALAGLTAVGLGGSQESVPKAVFTSQQHFAEDGAIALRASLDESVTDFQRAAALASAGPPADADHVLDTLGNVYEKWRGTAVVDIASGKLRAARGESLPLAAIDRTKLADDGGLAPRMVRLRNGETRLLSLALLSWEGRPQQLLVGSSSLKVPGISLGAFRSIAVVDTKGTVLSSDGIPEPEQVLTDLQRKEAGRSRRQLSAFARDAAVKAAQHPAKAKELGSGGFPGVSGSLTGEAHAGERAVAGYATLATTDPKEHSTATGLGLTVVAMVPVTEEPGGTADSLFGLLAAAALLLIGALTVGLLLGTVQRPLLQLFLESRRLSRGDLARPVRVPRHGEAARIGRALESLRGQLLGERPEHASFASGPPDAVHRHRPAAGPRRIPGLRLLGKTGTRGLLAVCACLLLAWSAPLGFLLNRTDGTVTVPQQLVNDQRERTDTLADRVRRALNEGHTDLTSVASLLGADTTAGQAQTLLHRTLYEHHRYRSLYVVDANGGVLSRVGEDPRATDGAGRDRQLAVVNDHGKEPVIVGAASVPGRKGATVVGEFRIDFLNALLKRPGLGQIRLVDADHRVIGGNTGYRAFQDLPAERLDRLVTAVNLKAGSAKRAGGILSRTGEGAKVAAAAPFTGGGVAEPLGWTVVSWQSATHLDTPESIREHRSLLAGLLGLTAAAACLGWLHIVVVRPLRELAGQAETLAAGDRRTVLYPRHHDEVGAVSRSLELIRQRLPARSAPAGRPAPTSDPRN